MLNCTKKKTDNNIHHDDRSTVQCYDALTNILVAHILSHCNVTGSPDVLMFCFHTFKSVHKKYTCERKFQIDGPNCLLDTRGFNPLLHSAEADGLRWLFLRQNSQTLSSVNITSNRASIPKMRRIGGVAFFGYGWRVRPAVQAVPSFAPRNAFVELKVLSNRASIPKMSQIGGVANFGYGRPYRPYRALPQEMLW